MTYPPGSSFLDWYIAVSAFFRSVSASRASCGKSEMPIDPLAMNSVPFRWNGSCIARCTREATDSATSIAMSVPGSEGFTPRSMSESSSRNSSPP